MENYNILDTTNSSNITNNAIWVDSGSTSIYNGLNSTTLSVDNQFHTINLSEMAENLSKMEEDIKNINEFLLIINRDIKMEEKYTELYEAKLAYDRILKNLRAYEAITESKGDE